MNRCERSSVSRRKPRSPRRRGSAILEFALVLPLLVTIALLVVDFGRFAHTYIAVSNAARAAAGYGCQNPFTPSTKPLWEKKVRQVAIDEMVENSWFNEADVTVTVPAVTTDIASEFRPIWRMRVEVSYPFRTLINWPSPPGLLPGYNETIVLRRAVVMRSIR